MTAGNRGRLLWQPDARIRAGANITHYQQWLRHYRAVDIADYPQLWNWSVSHIDDFWESLWQYFDIMADTPYTSIRTTNAMPDVHWFSGAQINYAQHAFRYASSGAAVIFRREDGLHREWSWHELHEEVRKIRGTLMRWGVEAGDRVVGYLPNIPETVAAFLATASLGAVWSSCSPDFGFQAVMDRFRQIEPKVLLAVDGYYYHGKAHDRMETVEKLRANLPTLAATILVPYLHPDANPEHLLNYQTLDSTQPLEFLPVAFEHPLWILYSSGTTGLPKAIVQGHGGILLSHLMALTFHLDLRRDDRFLWFTTTGWMMWNILVSGLLRGTPIVLYDGSPNYPDGHVLWSLAEDVEVTFFGTSAAYLTLCQKSGIIPQQHHLSAMRAMGSTGSPLSPESFEWVYAQVSPKIWLTSVSGGTDVCSALVGGVPTLPVRSGEIACRYLGSKVEAYDVQGRPVINEVGELVLTEPIPSMPLYFYGDDAKARYRASYFDTYPNVWRHGDWIRIHDDGSVIISGRSDATINRGGVRMGTSEFYRVVEEDSRVADSIIVDLSTTEHPDRLVLFVVTRPFATWDSPWEEELRERLRQALSPRHVPDKIVPIPEVPKTLNGKKMEIPLKRLLAGIPPEKAFNAGTMANPHAMDAILRQIGPNIFK